MSTIDDEEIIAIARAGFLDEALEMLAQFEQALLVMEGDPQNAENLNAAFRAAHTIKGSAGMFGFDDVVAFTHEVETLLEALRVGALSVDESLTALLLRSRDQMGHLLDEVRSGERDPEMAARSQALAAALRVGYGGAAADRPGDQAAAGGLAPTLPNGGASAALWHLSLRFGSDALRNGLDPLSFIRYLDTLGQVLAVHTELAAIPALEALDPESCHLGVEIRLDSAAGRAAIEGVFDFCVDDCDIAILEPDAPPAAFDELLQRRCGDEAGRGALLAAWSAMGLQLPLRQPDPVAAVADAAAAAADDAQTAAAAALIERRAGGEDRRHNEPERRTGGRDRRAGDETRFVRVRADKLDRLIDVIGELVIAGSGAQLVAQRDESPAFLEAALRICDLVEAARDGALGLRMVPIGDTFARFQRVVRDVSKSLGKEVELVITGGDAELDKSMVETIADPLMHLVRNSLDHGIETAEERLAAGKPAFGRLALNAFHEGGAIVIEVTDDGRGLDRERILAKAVERGLVAADAALPDHEVWNLIFQPGFSTAEQVTNISGRGVGMDVVKRNIEALRGQISIASERGRGSTMQIRLPLTLAMIDGFLTLVGSASYVLPLAIVAECIEVPAECRAQPGRVTGTFDLRGEVLPYLDLSLFYGQAVPAGGRRSLVLVRDGGSRLGLVVDRLLGEHQTVIKPLSPIFRHLKAISGSTILGSGEVALVIDVPGLMACAIQSTADLRSAAQRLH
jgi:two-component system, chemotaxis family, sensor kinase CheA